MPISGRPPSLINRPSGCYFHPRCPYVQEAHKRVDPRLEPVGDGNGHAAACLLSANVRTQIWEGLQAGREPESLKRMAAASVGASASPPDAEALTTHVAAPAQTVPPGEKAQS